MSRKIKHLLEIASVGLALALILGAGQELAAQSLTNQDAIQGTWTVTVTLRNCQTGK